MASPPKGIVPATPEMADGVAPLVSPEHMREVWDVGGVDVKTGLALSLAASLEAYAFVPVKGAPPVFLMGVEAKSALTGSAVVWMLGSELVNRRPAGVLRTALWGMERAFFITGAEFLEQFIPDWYRAGLRFARRLGFQPAPAPFDCRNGTRLWRVVAERRRCLEKWEKKWERYKP